jgi:hypothetical protein
LVGLFANSAARFLYAADHLRSMREVGQIG